MADWKYDPNVDYMALMKAADAAGNKELAAIYEQQRNEKIRGQGLEGQYPTTTNYAAYLPQTTPAAGGSAGAGLSATLEKIGNVGSEPFTYDPETDPSMQAYRKAYLREADRGTRDTMGAYAGMTQGVPSSAAITAASQAGDYYRAQLADKVPELEANAYSRYLNGKQQELTRLQLQQNGYEALIADAMNRWATLGRADDYVSQVLGVPVGTTTADQAYTDYQISAAKKDNLMNLMATGYTPDDNELAAAGMSRREAEAWQGYLAEQAAASAGGYGGGTSAGKFVDWEMRQELKDLYLSGNEQDFNARVEYLEDSGYDVNSALGWLGRNYGQTTQFEDGYNGKTSSGKARSDLQNRNTAMLN